MAVADLFPIGQAVGVAVGVEGVAAEVRLARVAEAIGVEVIVAVEQAVGVLVGVGCVEAVLDFEGIAQAVLVGIHQRRVGAVGVGLLAVQETVEVGVRAMGMRAEPLLAEVVEPVGVGVEQVIARRRRIESVLDLEVVAQAVAVAVDPGGIGSMGRDFDAIAEAIAIGIGRGRVRAVNLQLLAIAEAVVVAIRVER